MIDMVNRTAENKPRRILGAVIAGGMARRFGSDKALADLNGRALIDHAVALLEPHCADIVICGRAHGDRISLADRPSPDLGPLGGLAAALHHAAGHDYEAVLSVPCDMPRLPDGLVATFIANGAGALASHPVVGLWPASLSQALDAHLSASDDRSMRAWIRRAGVPLVDPAEQVPNINTPEDLARAARGED